MTCSRSATVRTYFGASDSQAFGHLWFLRAGLRATPKRRRSGLRDSGRRSPTYQDFAGQCSVIRPAARESRTASPKKGLDGLLFHDRLEKIS
jgi:hypothetical protein